MSGKGSMREKLALGLRKAQALGSGATDGAEASVKTKRGKKAKKKAKAAKSKGQVEELAGTKGRDDGKDQSGTTEDQGGLEARGGPGALKGHPRGHSVPASSVSLRSCAAWPGARLSRV